MLWQPLCILSMGGSFRIHTNPYCLPILMIMNMHNKNHDCAIMHHMHSFISLFCHTLFIFKATINLKHIVGVLLASWHVYDNKIKQHYAKNNLVFMKDSKHSKTSTLMHKIRGMAGKFVDIINIFNRKRNSVKMNIAGFAKIFHEQIDEIL